MACFYVPILGQGNFQSAAIEATRYLELVKVCGKVSI